MGFEFSFGFLLHVLQNFIFIQLVYIVFMTRIIRNEDRLRHYCVDLHTYINVILFTVLSIVSPWMVPESLKRSTM